jgi:AraC family transcriptional regulator of adaptative response/methylated-DNA-[protein]-cysteine methyltransferase
MTENSEYAGQACPIVECMMNAAYWESMSVQLPTRERKEKVAASRLGFAFARSPIGRVAVAGTAAGVSAIHFADRDEDLFRLLTESFPASSFTPAHERLAPHVDAVLAFLEGRSQTVSVPLDLAGTEFQNRVWDALRQIPYGSTWSYEQLAAFLDSGPRAVARSCATNNVALAIPCHRVVGKDGSLSGFRWGLDRKQKLLDLERRHALDHL